MDFTNLKNRKGELLDYLKTHGYSKVRYKLVSSTINWILKKNKTSWKSYDDVVTDRLSSLSKSFAKEAKSAINIVYRFDIYGLMPCGNTQMLLLVESKKTFYSQLSKHYKSFVDEYKSLAADYGTPKRTINTDSCALSGFFFFVKNKGVRSLSEISESLVIDYFLVGNNGAPYSTSVRALLKRCFKRLESTDVEFPRLLTCLPPIKHKRKNFQYLSEEEMDAVKCVLDEPNSQLSKRDRAMGLLLVHTWLRRADIVNLTFDAIDWDKETLSIVTSKTGVPTTQKLSIKVLNALWDYIENERAESDEHFIFITQYPPHGHISDTVLNFVFNQIFELAMIRQQKGDRKGCHLARHYGASMALSRGVPRPVISDAVAHSCPESLDTYLHADLVHLKACALSIEKFPVSSEVYHG